MQGLGYISLYMPYIHFPFSLFSVNLTFPPVSQIFLFIQVPFKPTSQSLPTTLTSVLTFQVNHPGAKGPKIRGLDRTRKLRNPTGRDHVCVWTQWQTSFLYKWRLGCGNGVEGVWEKIQPGQEVKTGRAPWAPSSEPLWKLLPCSYYAVAANIPYTPPAPSIIHRTTDSRLDHDSDANLREDLCIHLIIYFYLRCQKS